MKKKDAAKKKVTKRVDLDELLFMDDFDDMIDALERAEEDDSEEVTQEVNEKINREYAEKKQHRSRGGSRKKSGGIGHFFRKSGARATSLISSASRVEKLILAAGLAVIVLGVSVGSFLIQVQARASAVRSFTSVGTQMETVGVIGREGLSAVDKAEQARAEAAALAALAEEEEEEDEDDRDVIAVTFVAQTIKGDLKIKFVDREKGAVISGVKFGALITTPDKEERKEYDSDKDGIIYLDKLAAGDYKVEPLELSKKDQEKYKFDKKETKVVSVSDTIVLAAVDVSDEVKTEAEVGTVESMNNTVVESVPQDTVAWVESTKTPIGGGSVEYRPIEKSTIRNPYQASGLHISGFRYLQGEDGLENNDDNNGNNGNTGDNGNSGNSGQTTDPPVAPTIQISAFTLSSGTIEVGDSTGANVTCYPDGGTVWLTSDDDSIASISGGTTVNGINPGSAIITAHYKLGDQEVTATAGIEVKAKAAADVTVVTRTSNQTLTIGKTLQVTVETNRGGVTFSSSDSSVASVSSGGLVTAMSEGSATITATSDTDPSKAAAVVITVVSGVDGSATLKDVSGNIVYIQRDGQYYAASNADYNNYSQFYIAVETATNYRYTGWQTLDDGYTYYFTADGEKVTGEQVIRGVSYYFNGNGALSMGNSNVGIDVSSHQGVIDWNAVKSAGVSFAIIRCGVRTYGSGILSEDRYFRQNIQGAKAAGIKVGVYVYSSAVNEVEAVEEASLAVNLCRGYSLNYPIFIDMEAPADGRSRHIDAGTRTAIIKAFCGVVLNSGYRAGCYSNTTWYNSYINTPEITGYTIWLAQYRAGGPTYTRTKYDMWQYCSDGRIPGINTLVDMNYSYVNY